AAWEPGTRRMLVVTTTTQTHCPPPITIPAPTPGPPGSPLQHPVTITSDCGLAVPALSETALTTCKGDVLTTAAAVWELDSRGWSRGGADGLPCAMSHPILLGDPTSGRAMLVGSQYQWTFTGHRWQRVPLIPALAGRTGLAVAADPQNHEVVAFGG